MSVSIMLGILMDSDDRACWCASMLRINLPRRSPGRYEQILVVTVETANMPTPLSPTGEEAKATTTQGKRRIANCSPDPELLEAMARHTTHTPHALGLIPGPLQYRAHTQHTRRNSPHRWG